MRLDADQRVTVEEQVDSTPMTSGRALRSAAVYAFATALRGGVAFLLLPLYTRVLEPSEYGRLAVILTITAAASIIFAFGLDFALFRNYFQLATDPARQQRMVDSLWAFLIIAPLAGALVLSAIAAPLLSPGSIVTSDELTIGLIAAALFVSATTVPLSLMRARQQLRSYVMLSAIYTAATAITTVVLVVGFEAGVRGWLVAMLIANFVAFGAAARMTPWRRPRPFDAQLVRQGLTLGLPLIPHGLGHWALMLADRAVLATIVSTAAVGVYTLGATLALPALMLVHAIGQAFMPSYASAAVSDSDRALLPNLISIHAISVLAVGFIVALLGPGVLTLVAPPSYHAAAQLIPWIALGYIFLGLYAIPMNTVTLSMGRTKWVWIATAAAACTNIGLIYAFVPRYGLEAAAVASAAGYLMLLLAISWYSRNPRNPMTYEWSRMIRAVVVLGGVYTAAVVTSGGGGTIDGVVKTGWVVIAGLGLLLSGSIDARRLRTIIARLRPT